MFPLILYNYIICTSSPRTNSINLWTKKEKQQLGMNWYLIWYSVCHDHDFTISSIYSILGVHIEYIPSRIIQNLLSALWLKVWSCKRRWQNINDKPCYNCSLSQFTCENVRIFTVPTIHFDCSVVLLSCETWNVINVHNLFMHATHNWEYWQEHLLHP